ncbi:MAG TPA: pilin [Verrucomicrobiae bacterium]|nr:pilin [Verrucomicrobiae bacterium]
MKKYLKNLGFSLLAVVGAVLLIAPPASAIDPFDQACQSNAQSAICRSSNDSLPSLIQNIINVLIFLIGAISVIMIVIGGLRYTTSGGDSSAVTGAKNTILYAIIGLVVAISAYGIVNFVLANI